jgi:hypothetical protein
MYESMVLSSLKEWQGKRIEKYFYVPHLHNEEVTKLTQLHQQWYTSPSSAFYKQKDKTFSGNYNDKSEFEVDLYFKSSNEDICDCSMFLQGCVSELHAKTLHQEKSLHNKWVFVEMTAGPKLLMQKLFQLERSVRLLPLIDKQYEPAALCVLMNGPQDLFKQALDLVNIPQDAKINQYPLYIGWVPTRNVYSTMKNFETKLESRITGLESRMESRITGLESRMESRITGLESRITGLESRITGLESRMESRITDLDHKMDVLIDLIKVKK